MVVPHTIVEFAPIEAPRLTSVVLYSSRRMTWLRGLTTLVNTMDGPQKTSSSSTQPVYTETLFWILTLLPMVTSGEITTFCPILHFSPIRQFFIMWQKCQIFVPTPIS